MRARLIRASGHTRLPGYADGAVGRIEALHGGHVYPDESARGNAEAAEHLYSVVFEGRTLWGDAAEPGSSVTVDAFEPYLEPA